MEVHAHTHTARKKWTHYLWEFLMLFLAVFCGFLAENFREHQIEHKREKQYIRSLLADLEKDTAELHTCMASNNNRALLYDSLCGFLKRPDPLQDFDSLYYYFLPTTYYLPFHAAEGTIQQLVNAGGLRLIRNKQATDSITQYYDQVRATEGQGNNFLRYFDQYHEIAFQVFDYSQIDVLFYTRGNLFAEGKKYSLLTNDPKMIKLLFNKLFALRFILASYISFMELLEEEARFTMAYLKKEYHLK